MKLIARLRLLLIAWFCLWGLAGTTLAIDKQNLTQLVGVITGVFPWELAELSGLAHCRTTPGQIYAINDRGNQPIVYVLDLKASILHTFLLRKDKNKDWEDLSCGRCAGSQGECLYIADIGDNSGQRDKIEIYMVPLPVQFENYRDEPSAQRTRFSLRYPDQGHNAEAMMVHPSQPLLTLITKEKRSPQDRIPAQVFSADLEEVLRLGGKSLLKSSGTLPFTEYLTEHDPPSSAWITAVDFHPSGDWFMMITYTHLYRVGWPLHENESRRVRLPIYMGVNRSQVESVAFHVNGKQFWLGSEVNRTLEPLILMDLPNP